MKSTLIYRFFWQWNNWLDLYSMKINVNKFPFRLSNFVSCSTEGRSFVKLWICENVPKAKRACTIRPQFPRWLYIILNIIVQFVYAPSWLYVLEIWFWRVSAWNKWYNGWVGIFNFLSKPSNFLLIKRAWGFFWIYLANNFSL